MKNKLFASSLLVLLLLGIFPAAALAAPANLVVSGNNYTLQSGQTLNENLYVVGGNVSLMSGSTINGNVLILGGSVEAAGTINGNVTVLGGTLNLASTFILTGNLTTAGTSLTRDPGAKIYGQINNNLQGAPTIVVPGQVQIPNLPSSLNPLVKLVSFFLRLFLWTLAAMLLAMFIPNHLARTSQAALTQPLISGGLGLLTVIIVPIVLVLLAITICLIPASILGLLALVIAWVYGLISLGSEVGRRISAMSKIPWHPAISAGLGTLLLMAVLSGVEALIPCVGWIPKALVGMVGLGATLLTQFGMKIYAPTPSAPAANAELPPPV